MLLIELKKKELIHPPEWLPNAVQYLTLMGSQCYGCSLEDSDYDMYGVCIPTKDQIFPHLKGEILGFGKQIQRFESWQEHHIIDKETNKEYDFQVFSIVKYFQLLMDNNPNIIDSLFVPQNCIHHISNIGNLIRENRKIFLHKGSWHRFKGYAFSQMHKIDIKHPEGKRKELVEKYGYDVKFGSHVVRLLGEVEQILTEGDIDLQRNREQLKTIRRGEWSKEQLKQYFNDKEKQLEEVYLKSELPWGPDENKIKKLLILCLEMYFGNLDKEIIKIDKYEQAILEISEIIRKMS